MSMYAEKRRSALVHAYVLPWTFGLLCAACAQGPQEDKSVEQPGRTFSPIPLGHLGAVASRSQDQGQVGQGAELDDDDEPTLMPGATSDEGEDLGEGEGGNGEGPFGEGDFGSDDIDGVESVSRTPAAIAAHGQTDRDKDGLTDKLETNTGVFASSSDTGTDPDNPDSDADGLLDGEEVFGTAGGLDLPALGVSPVHRDLLLEYDWIKDSKGCVAHSHEPTAAILDLVTRAFANAPIANPDRVPGIHIIHDYGQGGAFTGGTLITGVSTLIEGGAPAAEYQRYRKANMAKERLAYFHYVLMAHNYRVYDKDKAVVDSSGNAEFNGLSLMVTLGCALEDGSADELAVAGTIMHELGHNLGLDHGGDEEMNAKPNYNSVMNYNYQFYGVDLDCDGIGNGVLDFSSNALAPLRETALHEPTGICNDTWIDWNENGLPDIGTVTVDVNQDTLFTELHDFDDWALIGKSPLPVQSRFVSSSESSICPALPTGRP